MDQREEDQSTLLTLQDTNQTITLKDGDHCGLLNITDEGNMTFIPCKLRKLEHFTLKQDKTTHEPYFVNETVGTDVKTDRFINPITVDVLEATDALLDTAEKQLSNL